MIQALKRALLPPPGPRRLPLGIARGVRMEVDFAYLTRTYLGLYEVELNRHLRRILKPGITAFDVGAQNGYDALVIAKRTRAPVASFECDARQVARMAQTFALNPELEGLIRPVEAMVGDADTELGLDEFAFSDAGFVPDFIKLDIDGGELSALRSAERLLGQHHPALIVEVHSSGLEQGCGQLLLDYGYSPIIVNQRLLLPDRRPDAFNRWLVAA
jgi:hypothetical protein